MTSKNDYKLFGSLILWMLIPAIYLLIRMQIVSINNVNINILGQMEWFDLIDETIVTALTVPLYYILKHTGTSKERNGRAFLISFVIYFVFTCIIVARCSSITEFMKAEYATQYLALQSVAMLIAFISTFMIILFTIGENFKIVFELTITRLILLVICDLIFIPKFADIGASYSEIVVNSDIAAIAVFLAMRYKQLSFGKCDMNWWKDWIRIGAWAGAQIVLSNVVYALVVVRMINAVSESGNYWVANNFIWGWLLVPVTCLAEIIKKNKLEKLTFANTWKFCLGIVIVWVATMPGWHWFISNAMAVDADMVLGIVYPVMPFYLAYMVSQMLEGWFISRGKTIYNAIVSAIVNITYYGIAYILFRHGVFSMGIPFIVGLFGCGMVVACGLDAVFYHLSQRSTSILQNGRG